MGHPSTASVHLAGRFGPSHAQVGYQVEQRLLGFSQIAHQRRPIVHLGIDVNGVFRVPGGIQLVIPHALQVGRLASRLRRADEQIAPVLHHQGHQVKVGAVEGFQALVCGQFGRGRRGQTQRNASILLLVFSQVVRQQLSVRPVFQGCQRLQVLLRRVSTDVVVIHEVGGSHNVEHGFGGVGHAHRVATGLYASVSANHHSAVGFQPSLYAFLLHTVNSQGKHAARMARGSRLGSNHLARKKAAQTGRESQTVRLVGRKPYDDGIVGQRCEHRAFVRHAIGLVAGYVLGRRQIQFSVVAADILMVETEFQTAQRQEAHAMRPLEEVFVQQPFGFFFPAGKYQAAHLGQEGFGLWAVIVVGGAAPECLLVQLYLLGVSPAINHGSQMAVAHRQRLQPM